MTQEESEVLSVFHPKKIHGDTRFKNTHENSSALEWARTRTQVGGQE